MHGTPSGNKKMQKFNQRDRSMRFAAENCTKGHVDIRASALSMQKKKVTSSQKSSHPCMG